MCRPLLSQCATTQCATTHRRRSSVFRSSLQVLGIETPISSCLTRCVLIQPFTKTQKSPCLPCPTIRIGGSGSGNWTQRIRKTRLSPLACIAAPHRCIGRAGARWISISAKANRAKRTGRSQRFRFVFQSSRSPKAIPASSPSRTLSTTRRDKS